MDRMKQWEKLADRCRREIGELYGAEEKVVVFGEGNTAARFMLVGEAPGEQETLQRRPFVGKAGKNLDEFLQTLRLPREALYITNVVKFRPCTLNPKTQRWRNRPPGREETVLCLPYLMEEVALVRPQLIVTLGNVALKAFLGKDASVGKLHGTVQPVRVKALSTSEELAGRLFPLYHPASVIYNRALADVYQNDLAVLSEFLDKEIGR